MLWAMMFYRTWSERTRVLAATAAAALVLYSAFSWGLPARYNSPDEAANAHFALRVAQGRTLAEPAPLVAVTSRPVLHPRSTNVVGDSLVPVSFLGFPLFAGFLGYLLGAWLLPYVTVLAGVAGLAALYYAAREWFSRTAAAFVTALVALSPAYWYYHARSFFHNALFFDLLLVSIWATTRLLRTKDWRYYGAAGLAAGLAIAVRSSEVFWVTAAAALWLALSHKELKPRYLWLMAGGAVLGFLPVLLANNTIYGHLLSVGYRQGLTFPSVNLAATSSLLAQLILPFSFDLKAIGDTTYAYLWHIVWWWAALAGAGLVYAALSFKRWGSQARRFALAGVLASLWLVVLYGSWRFNDNPDPTAVTLGTAYVRYWLPLYTFWLLPAGALLAWLWGKRWGRAIALGVTLGYAVLSFTTVVLDPQEGLLQVHRNVQRFAAVARTVIQRTEPDSVVVTDGLTDKFFWPERNVLVSEEPVEYLPDIRQLLQAGVPVYRFHPTWTPQDITYLNTRRLKAERLAVQFVAGGFDGYSLYRFVAK